MNLPELFRQYLQSQKVSTVTVRNYVADCKNFLEWLYQTTGVKFQVAGKSIFGLLTQETIEEYKADLETENTPLSTINRRLSAIRKLGQFGVSQGWLEKNEAILVSNASSSTKPTKEKALAEFKKHLEKEKVSQLTVKNYLSDLRHFLNWLELAT